LTDINVYAENFYRAFFNLLGYEFENTNFYSNNFAHIDLIDNKNKLAIQVTSQNDNVKIQESITGFFSVPEHKEYKLKILLIAKEAKNYRTNFGKYFNHKDDVLDINKLIVLINDITEIDKIKEIADFLDKNILIERRKTESSEVETIMALIEFLSKDNNRDLTHLPDNVDPDFKIHKRFSEHSEFILNQYKDLCAVYQMPLFESRKSIDAVTAIKITNYLKDESDLQLTKLDNNPKLALASLVELFYEKLSINGVKFDKQAIKFYLLDELIKCNVFPNK
jgi:hypothetical protein